jgi:hypothetical protein
MLHHWSGRCLQEVIHNLASLCVRPQASTSEVMRPWSQAANRPSQIPWNRQDPSPWFGALMRASSEVLRAQARRRFEAPSLHNRLTINSPVMVEQTRTNRDCSQEALNSSNRDRYKAPAREPFFRATETLQRGGIVSTHPGLLRAHWRSAPNRKWQAGGSPLRRKHPTIQQATARGGHCTRSVARQRPSRLRR